ncbi:MAG TPA: ribonuclease P protein component [Clostridiales bacterium]|nr:ribonuclease P protein component [Clostridiales bacterium]
MILIERLKRKSDFDAIFKRGKKIYAKSFMVLYLPSKSLKIGYCVSKKHGKAVVRNRIKRLLRAAVRNNFGSFDKKFNIVFLPKVKENYSFKEYSEEISLILGKLT